MNIKDIETQIKILFNYWFEQKSKQKLDKVRYAGPVLGKEEYSGMLDAIFDDWWSGGKYTLGARKYEKDYLGHPHSGSKRRFKSGTDYV